jgi:DNA-binding MarR family transcriptional regulator
LWVGILTAILSQVLLVNGGSNDTRTHDVLRILRGAGLEGLPTLDIAERMIEEAPGITRLLDRLEGKKLVRFDDVRLR